MFSVLRPFGATAAVVLMVFALGSSPARAGDLEDLLGDWTLTAVAPDGSLQRVDMKVAKGDEGLTGSLTNAALGELEMKGIRLDGDKHVADFIFMMGETEVPVNATVKVDGDTLDGKITILALGMALDVVGARVGTEAETALLASFEAAQAVIALAATATLLASDAEEFIGEYALEVRSPTSEDPIEVDFAIKNINLKVVAEIKLPAPLGSLILNKLSKTEAGLTMEHELNLGGQPISITINVEKDGLDKIKGRLADAAGVMTMDSTGVNKDSVRATTELMLGEKKVSIDYGRPSIHGAGYKSMSAGVPEGTVWRMGRNQATKLVTETDLKFGDTVVKAGSYGLWARRVDDAWHLIFNTNADAWGTPYKADGEVVTVPLAKSALNPPVQYLTIELESEGDGGVFSVSWGNETGSVAFAAAQ